MSKASKFSGALGALLFTLYVLNHWLFAASHTVWVKAILSEYADAVIECSL